MSNLNTEVTIPCEHCAGSGEIHNEKQVLVTCKRCAGSGRIVMEETGLKSEFETIFEETILKDTYILGFVDLGDIYRLIRRFFLSLVGRI